MSQGILSERDQRIAILHELGEWAMFGFYEAKDLPWPRPYGKAFRRLYELMDIRIPEHGFLTPFEPFGNARTRESYEYWTAAGYICDFDHHRGFRINEQIAEEKKRAFPVYAEQIDAMISELQQRFTNLHFGGYTHSNPDIRRVVNEGFLAMQRELDEQLMLAEDEEERNLLLALQDYAEGVLIFHRRTTAALQCAVKQASGERRRKLSEIAESFAHGFLHPARNFLEGLLAVNFTWMLDGCDSIGRFDQALGDLFEQDLQQGTLDLDFVRGLLDELWQAFERLNGWNLQIGGYTPDGQCGVNALTRECLAACARNHQRRPNVAFRVTQDTPDDVLLDALHVIADGSGRPAFYNDDLYIKTLLDLDLGLTLEDARELGFGGCTETMIAGMSNVGSLEGEINLAKALELALHDGYDPVNQRQHGPHTGRFADFTTFEQFVVAVQRQIQYMTDCFVATNREQLEKRFHTGDPKLYRTMFTRDCVQRRKSFEAGGARYNWAVVSYQGIANLIDGLSAVRTCVYQHGAVSHDELLHALEDNFVGHEDTLRLLKSAPKYGNDDDAVDQLGRQIIEYAWDELVSHESPRGGRYLPSCILFTTYAHAGSTVGATPDGRKAGEALTDSVGAVAGRDTHGPTALLNSVTTLPLAKAVGTPVLNLRFQKRIMQSEEGLRGIANLIRAYFAKGGLQVQLSVISREEMLAAQQSPDDYRDLIVRIGGYSEYFVALPRELQETVLERTEYAV